MMSTLCTTWPLESILIQKIVDRKSNESPHWALQNSRACYWAQLLNRGRIPVCSSIHAAAVRNWTSKSGHLERHLEVSLNLLTIIDILNKSLMNSFNIHVQTSTFKWAGHRTTRVGSEPVSEIVQVRITLMSREAALELKIDLDYEYEHIKI